MMRKQFTDEDKQQGKYTIEREKRSIWLKPQELTMKQAHQKDQGFTC